MPRITVNLKPRAAAALEQICSYLGEDKTDAVNNALRLYAMVLQAGPSAQLFMITSPGRGYERIHLP
jgi:hypothetical protein